MAHRPARSLRHEYELFVEEEIENYKESIPRSALLSIGDEAARTLAGTQQLVLTELLLWGEVDRIIFKRLALPSYQTWRRRRMKALEELRRPERWGLSPQEALVRAISPSSEGRVLIAGAPAERSALYLAAQGCEVTTLDKELDTVQRVIDAAEAAGLSERVHAEVGDLTSWAPSAPLTAVVCTSTAFRGLSKSERARAITVLQSATADGGVHLVETIVAGRAALTLDELRARYDGWDVSVEHDKNATNTFLARKNLS